MAVNVSPVKQLTNSSAKFEDLFYYNISDGEPIQNRIRLVKVGGNNYIAFSRFFFSLIRNPIRIYRHRNTFLTLHISGLV